MDIREQLIHSIAQNDIYILLLAYPLLGVLVWLVVGRGLQNLKRIAEEVAHRVPTFLEPVDASETPKEIQPLIEELNKLLLRLQQALEREKRFASDAAHELKTPLAALKTQAEVALTLEDEDSKEKALQNLVLGVDRSTHIVQQLLTLSRLVPETSSYVELLTIDLTKLAAEVLANLAPYALEKDIDIELDAPEHPIHINGNHTALGILLRNLVDNAIRYTPEKGKVKVVLEETDTHIALMVQDSGPGIPKHLRARVFERFFRILGSKASGSGLGLSIVQQIATLHHATIHLGTPPWDHGLQFEVRFLKD